MFITVYVYVLLCMSSVLCLRKILNGDNDRRYDERDELSRDQVYRGEASMRVTDQQIDAW